MQDLLKHTPTSHPDHPLLQDALRISQNFLPSINEEITPRQQSMTVKKGEVPCLQPHLELEMPVLPLAWRPWAAVALRLPGSQPSVYRGKGRWKGSSGQAPTVTASLPQDLPASDDKRLLMEEAAEPLFMLAQIHDGACGAMAGPPWVPFCAVLPNSLSPVIPPTALKLGP
ncbi:uncharacterized protein LOC119468624 [Cebus imitator]|uniref:uncharacterized protein LOC119468624 n=1 Tax=Cebus imitator TaxID=2715852 RepID=UPI0018983748|nr:uncharacterized protein LOC119468624 [Cebus imitator]